MEMVKHHQEVCPASKTITCTTIPSDCLEVKVGAVE